MDYGLALDQAKADAAAVERIENAIRKNPEDRKMQLMLASVRKRAAQSSENLSTYACLAHIDLVSYRIIRETDTYPLLSVSESISSFQHAVTGVVDSIVNGPKVRATFSAEVKGSSALEFAYSFPGSTGLVFSVRNKRDMFGGGNLDAAIDTFADFLRVADEDEARDTSRHLGIAAVGQLYEWVSVNAKWNNNVEYVWSRSDESKFGGYVSSENFQTLEGILEAAIEPAEIEVTVNGTLVGFDFKRRRFHFVDERDTDISGRLDDSFSQSSATVGTNEQYTAVIKEVEKRYATGRIDKIYRLVSLKER